MTSLQEKDIQSPDGELYRDIRAPFNGMRGKREGLNDVYNRVENLVKRASFTGMRGRRAPFNGMRGKRITEDVNDLWNKFLFKRARGGNSGFVGMRG